MRRTIAVAILFVLAGMPGCQKVKMKLGIGVTISNPEPGSPEKVIQDILKAATDPDEEAGWERFTELLHTEEVDSPAALSNWRSMKYPAIRKKAAYLLEDKSAFVYVLMDKREEGKSLALLVKNNQSDMPTPCRLRRDPDKGNAWRVFGSCF